MCPLNKCRAMVVPKVVASLLHMQPRMNSHSSLQFPMCHQQYIQYMRLSLQRPIKSLAQRLLSRQLFVQKAPGSLKLPGVTLTRHGHKANFNCKGFCMSAATQPPRSLLGSFRTQGSRREEVCISV